MKVLIADDSATTRRLLETTLQGWGYDVVLAEDGAEAWTILTSEDPPHLAILDWMMPVMSGPELCKRVRSQQRGRYTYLLLLTAKNQPQDLVEGMGAGADDYIVKPFDLHELEVRLRAGRRIIDLQIDLMMAQAALREQATRDSLTKCWNRATILEILDREIVRSRREERPLGLLMMDLDYFKTVNDTYGHAAGDRVLMEAVDRISASMRPYDSLGRYGGEEFLIVLPGCGEACVESHGERLRASVSSQPVALSWTRVTVTASFGGTSLFPSAVLDREHLLFAADEALYQAKRRGRNQVVFLPPVEVGSEVGNPTDSL